MRINNPNSNYVVNRKTNLRITPNTFLTNYLYDKVPDMKGKRHKIQMDDFIILEYRNNS